MGYRERKPGVIVDAAKIRLDGMKLIDNGMGTTINYGSVANPLTQADMTTQISLLESKVSEYNQLLEHATGLQNEITEGGAKLVKMYVRVLKGAVAQFGDDSSEMEVLGGTRASERKKPVKKVKPPTNTNG